MPELIKCVHCSKMVSSECKTCPHCDRDFPKGYCCYLCGKFDSPKNLLKHGAYYYYPHRPHGIHQECLVVLYHNSPSVGCALCGYKLDFDTPAKVLKSIQQLWSGRNCPSCGALDLLKGLNECGQCNLPILTTHRVMSGVEFDWSKGSDGEWVRKKYHECCWNSAPELAKTTRDRFWRMNGGCIISILVILGLALLLLLISSVN